MTLLAFGIIQVLLLIRIVLMLLNANEAQPLVSGLLMLSQPFVAPFEGIFGGTAANGSGSILDVAAIVALAPDRAGGAILRDAHGFVGAGRVRMNPFAFDVRHEHVGMIEHAVARMHTTLPVEMDRDEFALDGFDAHR